MAPQLRETRFWRSVALFSTGALITLACTRVKVTWDQAAGASPAATATAAGTATVTPALPPPSREQVESARSVSRTFAQVAEQISPSVVSIRVQKKQKVRMMRRGFPFGHEFQLPFGGPFGGPDDDDESGEEQSGPVQRGAGSGVVIDEKGYILTNNHVVGGVDEIKVQFADGKEMTGKIVGTDPRSDLAVISVDTKNYKVKAAPLGDSEKLLVGEWVMAIGNPFGLDHTVTVGVISAKGRSGIADRRVSYYQDFLQTDASINPGNSGGPLVNLNGEIVGINTAILGPGGNIGIGFAVPSDMARPVAKELISTGKVRRPYLGISMQEFPPEMAKAMGGPEKGALVQGLTSGAPADKAGVRRGDIIVKVDTKVVQSSRDVQRQVLTHHVGDNVALELWRDGKTLTLSAKTAELPGEEGQAGNTPSEEGQSGKVKHGLNLQTLTPQMADRFGLRTDKGVLITGVKPSTPAAEVGIQRGDIILEVDRRPVRSVEEVNKALSTEHAGGHVLLLQRGENASFVLLPSTPAQK